MNSGHLGWIRTLLIAIVGSTVAAGFAGRANAELLAYDGFDYTAGAGLKDLNGGSGWTSAWDEQNNLIFSDVIQAGSLSYMDSMGNSLQTTGGKLLNTGAGGTSQGGRSLARRNSGSTWMSFIAQRVGETDGDPANGLYPRGANLATFDMAGGALERMNIGPKNSNSFWNDPNTSTQFDYIQFRHPQMNNGVLEENLPNLATTRPTPNIGTPAQGGNFNGNARDAFANVLVQNVNLYVIRIDHLGDEMTADDVRVWINPRLDQTPSDSAVSFAYVAADIQAAADSQAVPVGCTPGVDCTAYDTRLGDQAFDRIRLFAGNAGAVPAGEVLYDEIRIATTFADVAPIAGAAGTIGDYNNDGKVDAADYTVWRDNVGNAGTTLQNRDPANGSGDVGTNDYTSWKKHFGEPAGSGSISATGVPEPSSVLLVGLGVLAATAFRRRVS